MPDPARAGVSARRRIVEETPRIDSVREGDASAGRRGMTPSKMAMRLPCCLGRREPLAVCAVRGPKSRRVVGSCPLSESLAGRNCIDSVKEGDASAVFVWLVPAARAVKGMGCPLRSKW